MAKQKHVMNFKQHLDTTTPDPSWLVAHRLNRADIERYDKSRGCFRGQRLRFAYSDIVPKAGDFIVRYDDAFKEVETGVVVLVGARRFYQIIGDEKALNELGKLGEEEQCA